MTDDINNEITQEQEAAQMLADSYATLVAMTAQRIVNDDKKAVEGLREDLNGLTDSEVRSLLERRIVADAIETMETIKEQAKNKTFDGLGDNPVLQ